MHPGPPSQQASGTQGTPPDSDSAHLDAAAANLLGRRISAWLAMHRIQATTLATAAGTGRSTLSRILHGAQPFPVTLARRLCEYTGLDPDSDSVTYDPARQAPARTPTPPAPKRRQRPPRPARVHNGEAAYTSGQVARMLGIAIQTLVNWEAEGKITSHRTPGGHRRYTHSQVAPLLIPEPATTPGGPQ